MTDRLRFQGLNTGFLIGFGYGVWMFVMLNYLTYRWFNEPIDQSVFCDPCTKQFGFPAALYEQERWAPAGNLIWFGLILDVLFATVCAVVIGLVCNFLWSWIRDGGGRTRRL